MLKLVEKYIKLNTLFTKDEPIILALSGGVDSFVLFDILRKLNYQIVVAHVNHNKRKESVTEFEAIKKICSDLNIPFRGEDFFHKGNNFHDESHKFRYSFFKKVCKEFNSKVVCTAHHQDDNLETVLLNIMGGSNLYGYSGISNKVLLDDVYIVRPLLSLSKNDILKYANDNKIKYFEDSSNETCDYKRNRIRHNIIPSIINEQSNVLSKVNDYSNILLESFNFIRKNSINYLEKWHNKIDIKEYKELDIALKKDIVCMMLEDSNIDRSYNLINDIVKLLISNRPQCEITLKENLFFTKRYNEAYISGTHEILNFKYEIKLEQELILPTGEKLYFSKNKPINGAKYIALCYNKIILPLFVRTRKDGDVINMPYGNKKIKDLFIDKKIVREKRDEILLICDSNDQIIWVVGYVINKQLQLSEQNHEIYLICED